MAANPYTTNLELQLDSRDITGLSDGDSVTTWTDSSAAGNDVTQSNASYRPVYKTGIIGSNPVVRWTGSQSLSLNCSFSSSWSGYSGITVFCLAKYTTASSHSYPQIIGVHAGSGDDYNSTGGFVIAGGQNYPGYSVNSYGIWRGGSPLSVPIFGFQYNSQLITGIALRQGTNGLKVITEHGASDTGESIQLPGTPAGVVIGNAYRSGAVSTIYGFVGDIAMVLIYKEYMSDSNIGSVTDWILDEFSLTTGGGSAGILRTPGMTGGING